MSPNPTQQNNPYAGMDIGAINLAKAIRQTESGGNFNAKGASGEHGAYQWTPQTWAGHAQQILGDSKAQMTPENQNAVAYGMIKTWKDQGLNAAQIAAKWNSGSEVGWENKIGTNSYGVKYNVPQYVKSVTDAYQKIKQGGEVGADPNNPSSTANQNSVINPQSQGSNAMFPSSPTDTPVEAGLKALGNTPQSALNFGIGVAKSVNPLETVDKLGQINSGFQDLSNQEGTGKAIWDIIKGLPKAAYDTLVPSGVKSLIAGDVQGASKQFTEDPFGQTAPVVLAAEGGAKLADRYAGGNALAANNIVKDGGTFNMNEKGQATNPGAYTGAFNKVIDTGASLAKPATGIASSIAQAPTTLVRSVISHLTNLDPSTISAIVSDPKSFSKLRQEAMSRDSVAESFGKSLDEMIKQKGETGAEYENIRQTPTLTATVPPDFITKTLNDSGLKVVDGKITADSNSVTRNPGDIKALQNFYDNWGDKQSLTPNEYLNMRKDIQGIAKFGKDIGVNPDAQVIGRKLYDEANSTIRPQITGLKELDAKMSPQIEQFKQAKKDFLNPDGSFKDGAVNKIANAKGLGKEKLLTRMETISPGITKSIEILKAVEDIQKANGIKVGGYVRSLVEGGGIVTGNLPLIITSILTNPKIAVQILRGFGLSGKAVLPVVKILQDLSGGVKNYPVIGLTKDQNEK